MKGVPLRLEIGPRDIENNNCVLVRRDTHEKITANLENVENTVKDLLKEIQQNLLNIAQNFVDNITENVDTMEDLVRVVNGKKVAIGYHCGDEKCEQSIKDETGIQTRVIIEKDTNHKCIKCGKQSAHKIYFARQY